MAVHPPIKPEKADLKALLRQQESLRQVIESISSELEFRPLLTLIVRHACELLDADEGTIGLVDEARQVVRTEAAYRMPAGELGAEAAPGHGLAGQVFLTAAPVILERYDQVAHPAQPSLANHAVVGLPIFWRGRMIGFFGIGAAPPRRFSPQDVETLSIFARHAAIAIENARLFAAEKQRAARTAIINRIGRLITGNLNLGQLLQTAVDAISEQLNYSNLALLLVDPDDPGTLVLRARSGVYAAPQIGDYRQSVQLGIVGAAARSRQRLLINDVWQDARYLPVPGASDIFAELAVPIVVGDRLLGVLNVESGQPIEEEEAAGFEIIADQLGVAIDNARLFGEIQAALDEAQLLYETSQRISLARDVDEVIAAYLQQVATRGRYGCNVVLYEIDEAGERTGVVIRGRWTPAEGLCCPLAERLPYTQDALDPPLDAGQTVTISNVHTDPRVSDQLRQLQAQDRRPALAMIPMLVRGQRIGLVILSYSQVHDWRTADLHPYQVTAAQLASAIDSRRQQGLLYERGQQVAVLKERQRLARDLHDSVTQLLFSITLIAQSIAPAWRRDPTEGEHRVGRLLELSQAALAEMRALLAELRPPEDPQAAPDPAAAGLPRPGLRHLQEGGLVAALRRHIDTVARDGLRIELAAPDFRGAPPAQEEALFRIAQEALSNAVKHADARQVQIRLRADRQATRLTVSDDGRGFAATPSTPETTAQGSGLGLITMRERAEAMGGTLELAAAPGEGTTVTAIIPRKDAEAR